MKTDILHKVQGEIVDINEFSIYKNIDTLEIRMKASVANTEITILFYNVSQFNIRNISYPIRISGFEILDNKENGWDKNIRYTIHDFEDGKICFLCEEYEIKDIEKKTGDGFLS